MGMINIQSWKKGTKDEINFHPLIQEKRKKIFKVKLTLGAFGR